MPGMSELTMHDGPRSQPLRTPPFRNGQRPTREIAASDYEPHIKKMILQACYRFQVMIWTCAPFAPPEEQIVWARKCWAKACKQGAEVYELTEPIIRLVRSCTHLSMDTEHPQSVRFATGIRMQGSGWY